MKQKNVCGIGGQIEQVAAATQIERVADVKTVADDNSVAKSGGVEQAVVDKAATGIARTETANLAAAGSTAAAQIVLAQIAPAPVGTLAAAAAIETAPLAAEPISGVLSGRRYLIPDELPLTATNKFFKKNSAPINFTVGKPGKAIWLFALPLIVGNVLQQLYNMVDSIVVGRFVGTSGLAALSASGQIIFLFNALFIGVSVGATIVVAQYLGAKNKQDIQRAVNTIFRVLFIVAVPVTAAGILLAKPLILLLNTPPEAVDMAVSYMRIVFIGTVAVFGFNITSGIMQGLGDSKSPLYFLAISTILNSILDVVFVYFLDLSVEGAAIATVIAQTASFIFSIFHINRKSKDIKIKLFKTDFDSKILKRIVAIGLPAGLQNTLFTLGVLVLQSLINRQGEEFLAGFGAANKIDSLVFMLIASFASALTAYVGQNVGAKKLDRVKKGVNSTILISSIISLSLTVLILAFSRPLLMLFATEEPVIAAGQAYLFGVLPFYIVLSALFLFNSALRGAGKSVVPLIASILSILLRVPSAYIITAIWGAEYMFLSYGIGWAFSILISGGYYISGRWKTGDLRSQ